MRHIALVPALISAGLLGCTTESATASLRALDPVGDVSLVCLGRDESGAFTRGEDRSDCPDYESTADGPTNRRFHALVTQPARGEVALVDLATSASQAVIDYEPTQPGYSFMAVGAEPVSIVSTPGGVASFVSVREAGREGVFALPSSCIAPRAPDEPLRDIRTWPACRLPAAPGEMVMLVDPAIDDDGDSATPIRIRAACDGDYLDPASLVGQAPAATRAQCPADLATEAQPGRRKLAVTLPSLSEVWVLDAQELLDRDPGSFDACNVEARVALRADVTSAVQQVPADLVPSAPSCVSVGFNHGPPTGSFTPWPANLALDNEGRLFVSDSQAPVVHVLDVGDPCNLSALPPLEPRSFTDPNAVITAGRIAVSPLTPLGKRFVYAVDDSSADTSGMLMAFDVSPGSTDRTPIVRERSALNPAEPPDRIALGRDVADVEFVYQDFPEPAGGVAVEGVACDPDPRVRPGTPSTDYRPSSDLTLGANPRKLRGTFAFAALHAGQLAIIDVEDLDGACRRPAATNPESSDNISGCHDDDPSLRDTGYRFLGVPTVSSELSCNLIAPHRIRSRSFFTNTIGGAPSAGLIAFPALTLETGRSVTADQSDDGRDFPKLLPARRAAGEAGQLFIGPVQYDTDDPSTLLDTDPATAERAGLLLSYEEPRAYVAGEDFTAVYEGPVRQVSDSVFSVDPVRGLGVVAEGLNASFCTAGVQDMDLAADAGRKLGLTSEQDVATFARQTADYVQFVDELSDEGEPYWRDPSTGGQCGQALFEQSPTTLSGRSLCAQFFGPIEIQSVNRDYRIVEAHEDYLLIEPRSYDPATMSTTRRQQLSEFASCCFPGSTAYGIRAGHQWLVRGAATGFAHDVITDPASLRCVADCNPLVSRLRGRAYEISCSENCPTDEDGRPAVGYAVPGEDVACVVDNARNGIDPGEPGAECIFQNLNTRFAIYRGQRQSVRDMVYHWQLTDGFNPLLINLVNVDRPRSTPQSLQFMPESSQLIVADGSVRGLTFVNSRNVGAMVTIF